MHLPRGRHYKRHRVPPVRDLAKKNKNRINMILRQFELKKLDTSYGASTPIAGTGDVQLISGIAVGDTDITRDGNFITVKSIELFGQVEGDPNVTEDTVALLDVFRTYNTRGTNPAITNALYESESVVALRDFDHIKEHQLLYSKRMVLPMRALAASIVIPKRTFYFKKNFKNPIPVRYDGITAVVADCTLNHFYVVMRTDQANTFQPAWTWAARLTFTDA